MARLSYGDLDLREPFPLPAHRLVDTMQRAGLAARPDGTGVSGCCRLECACGARFFGASFHDLAGPPALEKALSAFYDHVLVHDA